MSLSVFPLPAPMRHCLGASFFLTKLDTNRPMRHTKNMMTTLTTNKRAHFDYTLGDQYEAGLVLSGEEVKSIKTGHVSLKGAFVTVHDEELFLTNAFIPRYLHAYKETPHEDTRSRKLLLRRSEIRSLIGKVRVQGLTLVPIRLYTRKQLVKLQFAVGKGKKDFDKRADIGKKESDRRIRRALRDHS
jgi:SsrA-binding protein